MLCFFENLFIKEKFEMREYSIRPPPNYRPNVVVTMSYTVYDNLARRTLRPYQVARRPFMYSIVPLIRNTFCCAGVSTELAAPNRTLTLGLFRGEKGCVRSHYL